MEDEWRTPDEVCDRYKITKATLYRWNYDGTGPKAHRFGKHLRYRDSDLRQWEERRVAARAS